MKSFIDNLEKLFFTLLMILVLLNSFSYLTAENFRNQFNDDVSKTHSIICDTYFRCFINTINLGLRAGGGLGDTLKLE